MGLLEDAIRAYAKYEDRTTDPTAPGSGQALVYVKDGKLHTRNAAGTVTEYGAGAGGGGGIVSAARHTRTAGNYTSLNSTNHVAVDSGTDITLAASAGDVLTVGLSFRIEHSTTTNQGRLEVATIVSGSAVNFVGSGTATAANIPVWSAMSTGGNVEGGGSLTRTLVADDVSGGEVRLRAYYRVSSGSMTLRADSSVPFIFWAINHGTP